MYLYETHVHTSPISQCATASVYETLSYYKSAGYAGVFMTDHFVDGNFEAASRGLSYPERIERFFSAYEEGEKIGKEIGLAVFSGFEMSYGGTDFLVYGIDKDWCLAHPDMDKMRKTVLMSAMRECGALIIQAHPFREASYIDHIRLFPRHVQGIEVYNAERTEFENRMAAQYCENYGLIRFAGSDNHKAGQALCFGGMATDTPILSVADFIGRVLGGDARPFARDADGVRLL